MIRKRIVPLAGKAPPRAAENWLDLDSLAEIELTSEDTGHPIDSALIEGEGSDGWRADSPGEQSIRICFSQPQTLARIHLVFRERERARTQQFVLRWLSAEAGSEYREIVRQQYNFSPPHATEEIEDYSVKLDGLKALEIIVIPDIAGGGAHASLEELRLA